ncbi:MAG: tetratricopeptide repeat protein [Gemmatimonadetes bacterium]|nr:tetratricopeptide repeat protein [Gemmatimonadota bacterium]MDA1104633.1 tetratricopeptide repeat protein [Gemmatimonadota bacterium]
MSQRHPGARRTNKSDSSDADDVFVANVLDAGNWAQANQQALTVAGVIAAIAIAGLIYYGNYRGRMGEQAAEQLEVIHQSISIRDTEGARIELVTFLDRFGGTPFEGEARMMLGELYLENGSPQQALAVLRPLGTSPRSPIEFQGAALLGVAYEQEGRWDDAEDTYLVIANRSELDFQVRAALASAARIRGAQGDAAGAIQLYERVLSELDENAVERGQYEMRIEEIRSATRG